MEPAPEVVALAGGGPMDAGPRNRCHAFFSYRHDDNQILVQSVWRHLQDALPGWSFFLDIDGLSTGDNFRQIIFDQIKQATVVFAFVGPNWEGQGGRIQEEDDFVRTELTMALVNKKYTVPVVHSGRLMPSESSAPPGLAWLFAQQGVTIAHSHASLRLAVNEMRRFVLKKVKEEEDTLKRFIARQGPVPMPIELPVPPRLQHKQP